MNIEDLKFPLYIKHKPDPLFHNEIKITRYSEREKRSYTDNIYETKTVSVGNVVFASKSISNIDGLEIDLDDCEIVSEDDFLDLIILAQNFLTNLLTISNP